MKDIALALFVYLAWCYSVVAVVAGLALIGKLFQ
jgi:hypothetical protein